MELSSSTIAQDLTNAMNRLTPETWRKGNYFKSENNTLCMCAHGALQAEVNPQVRKVINNADVRGASEAAAAAVVAAATAVPAAVADRFRNNDSTLKEIWNNRPDYIKQERIYNGVSYGFLEAHYILGLVGCTTTFNDAKSTTLEMVQAKYLKAIVLATEWRI